MYQKYRGGKIECNKWNEDSCIMGVRQYMSENRCMGDVQKEDKYLNVYTNEEVYYNIWMCSYSAEMQDDGNFVIYVSFDFLKKST